MDRVYGSATITTPPDESQASSSGYPTSGSPASGQMATRAGPYWYHMMTESLRNVIVGAGLSPSKSNLNLVAQAIQSGALNASTAGGTADAITAAFTPAVSAWREMAFFVRATAANTTTAPTFTPNSGTIAAKTIVKGANAALVAGDIAGAGHWLHLRYDANLDKVVLLNPATGVSVAQRVQIQTISASVASNALTLTLNPTNIDFRSSTLSSGAVNTRSVTSALSLTVPSGASLGTIGGQQARLAALALDNNGTIELAVVNLAGGSPLLDETNLMTTVAISAAATSASTVYSTTARTSLPYRVVGFVDITEATAGTWATAPTVVQGQGGQAISALQSIGYGQAWQDMTASRVSGTTYYNTTGRPIAVSIYTNAATSASAAIYLVVNGLTVDYSYASNSSGNQICRVSAVIPPGASYSAVVQYGSSGKWNELR